MNLSLLALKNISRNKRRSLLCIIAIAVAAMSIVLLFSLLNGFEADITWNMQSYFTGQVRVRHQEFDENELVHPLHLRVVEYKGLLDRIDTLEKTNVAVPRINFPAILEPPTVSRPEAPNQTASGVGVDFSRESDFQELDRYLTAGTMPRVGENEVLLGSQLAEELDKEPGDSLTVLATTMRRGANAATYTVSGIVSFKVAAVDANTFYLPLDRAQRLLGMGDSVTEVLVKFPGDIGDAEAKALVASTLLPENQATAKDWREQNTMIQMLDLANVIYMSMAVVFFILASSVIINSIMMIIFERLREIGTIGALGMESGSIVRLFFMEAFHLALLGAVAGTLLGIGFTLILSRTGIDFSQAVQGGDYNMSGNIFPILNLKSTLLVFCFAVSIASLSSIIPTRRAARIEPVEALRG